MSDVPLGAMLSGGLDSSLIVALMARNMIDTPSRPSASASARTPKATSSPTPASSPTTSAPTTTSSSSPPDDTVDLPELVWHLDEPLADLSALGFLALCQLATPTRHRRPLGQGADELLGGYREAPRRLARGRARLPAGAPALAGVHAPEARSVASSSPRRSPPRSGRASRRDERQARRPMPRALTPGRWPARRRRGAAPVDRISAGHDREPAAATCTSTPSWRSRRHAPLLRPHLDGPLARSPRPLPRPQPRRILRQHPPDLKVRRSPPSTSSNAPRAASSPSTSSTSARSASSAAPRASGSTRKTSRGD